MQETSTHTTGTAQDPHRDTTQPTAVKGFAKLHHELSEFMAASDIFDRKTRVFMFLFRMSHGYGLDYWDGCIEALCNGTGLKERTVQRGLGDLEAVGMVRREQRRGYTRYHVASGRPTVVTQPVGGGVTEPDTLLKKENQKKTTDTTVVLERPIISPPSSVLNYDNGLEEQAAEPTTMMRIKNQENQDTRPAEVPGPLAPGSQEPQERQNPKPEALTPSQDQGWQGKPTESKEPFRGDEEYSAAAAEPDWVNLAWIACPRCGRAARPRPVYERGACTGCIPPPPEPVEVGDFKGDFTDLMAVQRKHKPRWTPEDTERAGAHLGRLLEQHGRSRVDRAFAVTLERTSWGELRNPWAYFTRTVGGDIHERVVN